MEILRGYSTTNTDDFGTFYIKHTNYESSEGLDELKESLMDKAVSEGLPTLEEREKDIIKEGDWTEEREREMVDLKSYVNNLKDTKSKVLLEAEIESINKDIKESTEKVNNLFEEKQTLIGYTAETYASKKVNEYYLVTTAFKDKELEERLITEEEFNYLQDEEIVSLTEAFVKDSTKFTEENIKRISLCTYFMNFFSLSDDNPMTFYGKPIVGLTFNQVDLFSYGRYFKTMIQNMNRSLTTEELDDPDKIIDLFNTSKNVEKITSKSQKKEGEGKATSIVGATKEDMERMGLSADQNPQEKPISLLEEANKKGGNLSMEDLIKLHGA